MEEDIPSVDDLFDDIPAEPSISQVDEVAQQGEEVAVATSFDELVVNQEVIDEAVAQEAAASLPAIEDSDSGFVADVEAAGEVIEDAVERIADKVADVTHDIAVNVGLAEVDSAPAPNVHSEFMGEHGGQVTGRGHMAGALASGDGDEGATAQVAQVASDATAGTIFHQVYRPWRGTLNSRWVRNWAILRYHVYGLFSKGHKPWPMLTRLVIFGVLVMSLGDLIMLAVGAISATDAIERISGISRGNLYGHVLSFWFRNACTYPIVTALIIGGMISEDRRNGTSALYFSRPVNRRDYAAMKFLSVAIVLAVVVLFTLTAYYLGAILINGEGWAYVIDTGLLFAGAFAAGTLLVFTYTSLGLALSSVSSGKFFPAVAFIGMILGTKLVAFLIFALFDSSVIYLLSPYDNLAHVGQWMLGLNSTYEHPASWSFVMLLVMNAVALYLLSMRVSSLEVTRE